MLKIYENPDSKITPAGKEIIKELEDLNILWMLFYLRWKIVDMKYNYQFFLYIISLNFYFI